VRFTSHNRNHHGRRHSLAAVVLLIALLRCGAAGEAAKKIVEIPILPIEAAESAKISYTRDVKPLLVDNCLECHSPKDHKGGLDASSVAGMLKGGKKAGASIIPGKPDDSPLIQYVRGLKLPQMPKGSPALDPKELHLLREWIAAGARDDSGSLAAATPGAIVNETDFGVSSAIKTNAALQRALEVALHGTNGTEKLLARRQLRIAALPPSPIVPKMPAPGINEVDAFLESSWEKAALPQAKNPPAICDDATFVRRAYLDVIGVIPSVEDAKAFIRSNAADKRAHLIDSLLARKDDYAANWTPFWEEAIASANVDKVGGIASRGNHRDWIFKSFAENKPFDLMVAELIDPTLPGYRKPIISEANGKRVVAAFIRNESHVDTIQSAAVVGQVFMGTGMKCASCHSHFLNKEWPQARFLAFAGMFAEKDLELIRCEKQSGQFIPARFPFEISGLSSEAPAKLDERLHRAAALLIDPANPRFSRTIVNRLWKRYFGLALFEPQDDFRTDRVASQPELLEWLADDFMRHGYDLKHTIRLLLTSRAYQLRYDPALEDHFDINKTEQSARYYRSPSLRRLTAEQLLDSVQMALNQKLDPGKRVYLDKSSTALTRALGKPAAHNEISTARPDDVAVVQALELLNGEEWHARIYTAAEKLPISGDVAPQAIVDQFYWMTMSRPAKAQEQERGARFLQDSAAPKKTAKFKTLEQNPVAAKIVPISGEKNPPEPNRLALGDVLWALLVSPEFQYLR
jgi:hypothetical protein